MKKLVCSVLAIMLFVLSFGVLADTVTVEIDYDGEYVTFDDMFSLYLPNSFSDGEITDDMDESGIFAYYLDQENGMAMVVQWFMPENGEDLEAVYNELVANGNYSNVGTMTFNSVPFIVYDAEANDAFGCMCADGTEDGGFYIFSFSPDDESTSTLALKIMSSIQ